MPSKNPVKILLVFGTRPEAIKLAPVIKELKSRPENCEVVTCVTAQHREMLDQVLRLFQIEPDLDLNLMQPNQTLSDISARVMQEMDRVMESVRPDVVLVQGDTTTVMATSLAAFHRKVPLGHVEAGLRSGNIHSPFPEELNRRVTTLVSRYHFAPTETSRQALLKEGVENDYIYVTGNPVIDALNLITQKPRPDEVNRLLSRVTDVSGSAKLILVTAHRRENFGKYFENICLGLKLLTERNQDIVIIYPVHMNPKVRDPVFRILNGLERIILIDPVEYDVMAHLLNEAYIVLTDSGGIQEEAPALGKPVLVMRTETERPDRLPSGCSHRRKDLPKRS